VTRDSYLEFLAAKITLDQAHGCEVAPEEINPLLFPHQRDIVRWAAHGGRRAIFAAFGLGKSFMQLEIARLITEKFGGCFLIVAPLGVRQEFKRDAEKLALPVKFIRSLEECSPATVVYLTNYETVRDGKLDPTAFAGASLDEASVLRGFGGTKTFREFMRLFESVRFKFVATATPSPNDYIELLAYAAFLGVMDVGQAKTRFFKRDSTKADKLTLHSHKEREFWLWVSSWAIFLQKPSDLGYSDEGYALPAMHVYWHEIPSDHTDAGHERDGQARLLRNAAIGVQHAAKEKRDSLPRRIAKLLELRTLDPAAHRLIWHDLESERAAIEKAIPQAVTVWGNQDLDAREQAIIDFSDGKIAELATKPVIAGSGCNFQRHCAWAIFLGIGFKFNDFIQAIHRIRRYLQPQPVRIDLIYTEAEREVRRVLEDKWAKHKVLVAQMTEIIRRYGLATNALESELKRSIGVERAEASGEKWRAVNNDCVLETKSMEACSVHLILTSIPFSTQYEYTPSYNDFGHTESNDHFWRQMDFLTPELLRVLRPGRNCVIHVKDRIMPGGLTGLGFQTVYPFHCDAIAHFTRHGFAFLGMKTIVTDVVRENNQTYRLGWTEQCKDGSRMGAGMPEYLLLFRKPPTDRSNGYADDPVAKDKAAYSRSRWQVDAHGFMRSSGNRLLSAEDLVGVKHEKIFKLFRDYSLTNVYDYEHHVALGQSLETCSDCGHIHVLGNGNCACGCQSQGRLPVTFMLLQPQSWHPDVWTDITRMLTMNGAQSAAGREMHLCPMQFDLADRVINQFSMKGEIVFDPFAGLMTVPMRALKLGRRGWGVELNGRYWADGVRYLEAAERQFDVPDLFDLEKETSEVTA
jgi:DNA modification methylase